MTPKGLCIVTRCTSTDELVARLHPFCDDTSIFVTTSRVWEVGTASRFAITLADKTVVLHGRCTVIGAWSTGNNPFGRPGVRLELVELAGNSRAVFNRMQENRKAGEPVVKPHPMVMVPMPNEISDAFARATSSGMPASLIPTQLDDGPTDRTEQPAMLRPAMIVGRAAVVSQAITLDTTARSSSPPMPPRIAKPGVAKPPPPPSPRTAFGSPLHGNVPLGTPLPTRRARGTDSIVGLGPCPGANDLDPDTIVQKAAPVTVLTVDTVRLAKKVPPLAVELPPPSPIARLANAITSTPQAVEIRTPGSPYVLPANPLTGLSDAALFGFVDCTLYEDPAGEEDPADGAVAEPVPVTPSMVNRVLAELEPAVSGPTAVEPSWSGPVITIEPAVSEPVITIEPAVSEPVITIEPAVSEANEAPAMIISRAPVPAPLPTIESRAARLPWRSIGRITGVVAVVLMTAFLILFGTGGW